MHQLDVAANSGGEMCEVLTVDGHDFVSVNRQQHDSGIDHVGEAGGAQKSPSGSSEHVIQCSHIDTAERLGKASLT
jgi:hypothetical protein